MYFSAMIYGWSFTYDIGERARGIEENFELEALGTIPFGDPGLKATEAELRGMVFHLWSDYNLNEKQKNRLEIWKAGQVRGIQGTGEGLVGTPAEEGDWFAIKRAALESAAKTSIRAMLQSAGRNRPKQALGFISLAQFPRYWISGGRVMASARFLVEVKETIPFAAY
jgi:hypothetical protein